MEVSVLVPAYNAAAFLAANLKRVADFLQTQSYLSEIIVIDDGSSDRTGEIAEHFAIGLSTPRVMVLRNPRNEGKGSAVIRGLRAARGRFAVILDADLAYPPEQIVQLIEALHTGADLAIANRQLPASRLALHRADLPHHFLRYIAGRMLNAVVRALLLPGLNDTQAGLKALRLASHHRLLDSVRCRGFGIDVELLLLARKAGLGIVEIPVRVESRCDHSTVRLTRDSGTLLRDLSLICLRSLISALGAIVGWQGHLGLSLSRDAARRTTGLLGVAGVLVGSLLMGYYHLASVGKYAVAGWMVALGGITLLGRSLDGGWQQARRPHFGSRSEAWLFVGLLALVAGIRFPSLGTVPPMMHGDSAECGILGRTILSGGVSDIFDFSPWYETPFISFVPYAASFGAFGLSVFSLRLPSALLGTLSAVPLYFLTRAWFGTRAAQLATLLFAFSHPIIHFSRIGLWNIQVMFFQLTAFALLVAGLRRRSAVLTALAGIVSGLSLFSYTAARIIPVTGLVVVAFALVRARRDWRPALRVALPYGAALVIAALPLALNYVKHPEVLGLDRTNDVSVFAAQNRPHVEATYGVHSSWGLLRAQTVRTLEGFITRGDVSTQYGTSQPLVSPFSLPFLLIGVGLALWHISEVRYFFLLAWLGLILVLGSILIIDPPSHTRLVGAFPAICVFVAIGLDAMLGFFERRRLLTGRGDAAALCGLLLLQAAAFNLVGYYNFLRRMDVMPREWDVLKVFTEMGERVDYYLFTGPFLYADSAIFRLFGGEARMVAGFSETDIPERLTRDAVFVLTPEFRRLGVEIQRRLPGAELDVYATQGASQIFVYRCTAENTCRRGPT